MPHALIIDANMIVSRAIEDWLLSHDFASCDRVWSERQADEAVERCAPDLVVVGESVVGGSPGSATSVVQAKCQAPVLRINADQCHLYRKLPEGVARVGQFNLSDLDAAVVEAQMPF